MTDLVFDYTPIVKHYLVSKLGLNMNGNVRLVTDLNLSGPSILLEWKISGGFSPSFPKYITSLGLELLVDLNSVPTPIGIIQSPSTRNTRYAIVPKPSVIIAFKSLKELNPDLTIKSFLWNTCEDRYIESYIDRVEFKEGENVADAVDEVVESLPIEILNVKLYMRINDVEKNEELLSKIFKLLANPSIEFANNKFLELEDRFHSLKAEVKAANNALIDVRHEMIRFIEENGVEALREEFNKHIFPIYPGATFVEYLVYKKYQSIHYSQGHINISINWYNRGILKLVYVDKTLINKTVIELDI